MAPRLLLDEHVSPQVARLLRPRGVAAIAVQEWHGGRYLSRSDQDILEAAHAEGLALGTFDVRWIPVLLRHLAEVGREHAGSSS